MNDYSWPDALRAAMQAAQDARPPVAPRRPVLPCRCGWRDDNPAGPTPREPGPVADLTGCEVTLRLSDAQRTCTSCGHAIRTGTPVVAHYLGGAAFYLYYHPVCTTGVHP